ncbi:MAG: metallophosphoesterase [Clostridia bacterium]|nr:metallophosphoesterase [Clostridia bacterium]
MAIYVTSDLHGLAPEKLTALLDKAGFGEDDWLYILGDVIDRTGDGGVAMLLWLMEQPNVQLLRGNHEEMLLSCAFVFEEITEDSVEALNPDKMDLLNQYIANGGDVTLKHLHQLKKRDPERIADILDYLWDTELYEAVEAGGQTFLLVHAGIEGFTPGRKLSQYPPEAFLWPRPDVEDAYFPNVITVFGHTPTIFYDYAAKGRIYHAPHWIDIDVGVQGGCPPALLRLDDLAEFYL